MKVIKEIYRGDNASSFKDNYRTRLAARAVLLNEDNEVALLYVSKKGYHKLPGGGIDEGESIIEGLNRELLEETGYKAKVESEIGLVIQYLEEISLIQFSFCYFAKVISKVDEPNYTDGEIEDGFQLVWLKKDDAIRTLATEGENHIRERDSFILETALTAP